MRHFVSVNGPRRTCEGGQFVSGAPCYTSVSLSVCQQYVSKIHSWPKYDAGFSGNRKVEVRSAPEYDEFNGYFP